MARWHLLREALERVDGLMVTYSWQEFDQLVDGVPASATMWASAWWTGKDRPNVKAWTEAGFAVAEAVPGQRVTFVRSAAPVPKEWPGPNSVGGPTRPTVPTEPGREPDLLLVACVKQKQPAAAPAKDLYISPLFRKERAYAESLGKPWFILSAEYGVVSPEAVIAPYECYLPHTSRAYRATWGKRVVEQLSDTAGSLNGRRIEIHAGSAYIAPLRPLLEAEGAIVIDRLQGLSLGQRLGWYGDQSMTEPVLITPPTEKIISLLSDERQAVTPAEFLAKPTLDFRTPGLYSWWVDEAGAKSLAEGIGLPLEAGLIYAGLAGATRWPSGKRSANTLRGRIATMHLGGDHRFSTFRFTLGSILAASMRWTVVDESALTEWMQAHLRVIAVPYEDADTLGSLESEVLIALDPPLNLSKVGRTLVRSRIASLRRQLGKAVKRPATPNDA